MPLSLPPVPPTQGPFPPPCWPSSPPVFPVHPSGFSDHGAGSVLIHQTVSEAPSVTRATGQHPLPKGQVMSTCAGNNRISLGCFKVKDYVSES